MDFLPFLWGLITAAILVVAVFLVRALIEIRKTVVTAGVFVKRLDTDLVPVINELKDVLADLKVTADVVASRVDDVKSAMEAVGDTGRNISRINRAVSEVADILCRLSVLSAGVKAAGQYVADKFSRRRG